MKIGKNFPSGYDPNDVTEDGDPEWLVVVNEIEYSKSHIVDQPGQHRPYLRINDEALTEVLLTETFKSVGEHFCFINYKADKDFWNDSSIEINVYCNGCFENKLPSIKLGITINYDDWAKPWSINDFRKSFKTIIGELDSARFKLFGDGKEYGDIYNSFGIFYYCDSDELLIGREVDKAYKILEESISNANKYLFSNLNKDSLITYFNFPEEIQTSCSQYLVYFTQFLADIGINANTEIVKQAKRTLFKVTPTNKEHALTTIQDALAVYLDAPGIKDLQGQTGGYNDIAIKQWEANIYHLKSQLSLSASILQAKDATIEALHLSNFQYKQLLDKNGKNSREDLIKDLVSLKEYEGTGFVINFPEILRRLKRIFK